MAENIAVFGERLIWFIKNLLANQRDHAFLGKILKQSKDIYLTFTVHFLVFIVHFLREKNPKFCNFRHCVHYL